MDPVSLALGLLKAYFEFLVTPQGQLVAEDSRKAGHDVFGWGAAVMERFIPHPKP